MKREKEGGRRSNLSTENNTNGTGPGLSIELLDEILGDDVDVGDLSSDFGIDVEQEDGLVEVSDGIDEELSDEKGEETSQFRDELEPEERKEKEG